MTKPRKKRTPAASLVIQSHAKINLFLDVLRRRPDGYHDIATLMHEISLADTVRLCDAPSGGIRVECDMPGIPSGRDNLAYKAASALRRRCGIRRGVRIVLQKQIPPGAGLGGGSSNAASVLKGLNRLWKLRLKQAELVELAAGIGSDVPFFIVGGTALCTGRGEKVRRLSVRGRLNLVLAIPPLGLSTADVYRSLKVAPPGPDAGEKSDTKSTAAGLRARPIKGINLTLAKRRTKLSNGKKGSLSFRNAAEILFNRLEEPAFGLFPEVKKLKSAVARACSGGALLCGSGSAVFGLCRSAREAASAARVLRKATGCEVVPARSRW